MSAATPLARALRPLRHVIPLPWRIQVKTWIRDRSRRSPALNRVLHWFTSPVALPAFMPEWELPPPTEADWHENLHQPSPLLTLVIPFHNQGAYVVEALESIWAQTFQDFEVIVVDDGSDDSASVEALRGLSEPRLRVIRQENRGLPAARNAGLRHARGPHCCCLDADDALRPTHFEKLLLAIESRGCDLAHCDSERFDQGEGVYRGEGFHAEALLRGNAVGNAANAIVRLDAWERVGGYCEDLAGYQDWNFWLDLAAAGCQAAHVPEPLFLYRRHGTSMISRSTKRHEELTGQIRALHQALHDSPEKVEALESARQRLVCRDPFINLTAERHRKAAKGIRRLLFIAPRLEEPRVARALAEAAKELGANWEIFALGTALSTEAPIVLEGATHVYHARPMVPEEHAAALPAHLCNAHGVSFAGIIGFDMEAGHALRKAISEAAPSVNTAVIAGSDVHPLMALVRAAGAAGAS